MAERLQYPLSIFVVWHPDFKEGTAIANDLYSLFCRDVNEPLVRGIGIPVYYRFKVVGQGMPLPINTTLSTRNAIIILADINYCNDKKFCEYTKSLVGLTDNNTRIFPIELYQHATGLGCGLSSIQFTRAYKGGLQAEHYKDLYNKEKFDLADPSDYALAMKKIKTELLNDCARLMIGFRSTSDDAAVDKTKVVEPPPVKLFLSHAKKDGLGITKRFKAYVDAELKLDVFFDAVDIADGYTFERQIEQGLINSALVVFQTDEYATREWCRIEVLIAKRNKCSIVVVNAVKKGEKRAFPYLGNTPTITLVENEKKCFNEIVDLTLYQVLNNRFQLEFLESFKKYFDPVNTELICLSSPPELFNYLDIYKQKKKSNKSIMVLYPDPPLGAAEIQILNDLDKDINFLTPVLLSTFI